MEVDEVSAFEEVPELTKDSSVMSSLQIDYTKLKTFFKSI